MQFFDDSLLPENQQPLVIQVAPYGPEFLPGDSDDIPVTMDEQILKAVDCYNAGATVLHVHCLAAAAEPPSFRCRAAGAGPPDGLCRRDAGAPA